MVGVVAALLKDDIKLPPASIAQRSEESVQLRLVNGVLVAESPRDGEWQILSLDGRTVLPPSYGRNLSVPLDRLPRGMALVVFREPGQAPVTRRWVGR